MVCHFLIQGIFLTQGSNPCLPHCRQMLYHLSHQERSKGNPEEMPHTSDLNHHKGTTLPLIPPGVYTHTVLFLSDKYLTCFYTFHLNGNSFLQSQRARALSLTTGLAARIWGSLHCGPTSISGWKPKPHFKPLQAEAMEVTSSHLHGPPRSSSPLQPRSSRICSPADLRGPRPAPSMVPTPLPTTPSLPKAVPESQFLCLECENDYI